MCIRRHAICGFISKKILGYLSHVLARICSFLFYNFYQNQGLTPGIPKYRIIYSILGLDMYAQAFGQVNFAIVGEWFLGMIILFTPFSRFSENGLYRIP